MEHFPIMLHRDPSQTLIVFALESETNGLFGSYDVLYTGVGKVNAAYRLTKALEAWRIRYGALPQLVLNMGSAGSGVFPRSAVVNCTRFVQRDFDVTALGLEPYGTPFDDVPAFLMNGERLAAYPEGVCGTGDNFMTNGAMSAWNIVDMEAYALAKVCLLENIPFACLKYITDGADGHAATTWETQLAQAAKSLHEAAVLLLSDD